MVLSVHLPVSLVWGQHVLYDGNSLMDLRNVDSLLRGFVVQMGIPSTLPCQGLVPDVVEAGDLSAGWGSGQGLPGSGLG